MKMSDKCEKFGKRLFQEINHLLFISIVVEIYLPFIIYKII